MNDEPRHGRCFAHAQVSLNHRILRVHLFAWCGAIDSEKKGLWEERGISNKTEMFVRLSLLTMTNPNQLCNVLLFVCSKVADEINLSSKLLVADRTREVWGRKLYWWCLSPGFPLCTFLLGFAGYFCFVYTSTPSYEASPLCLILCNLFPWLCWYVVVCKAGFEGVLVSLLLTTMGAFPNYSSP